MKLISILPFGLILSFAAISAAMQIKRSRDLKRWAAREGFVTLGSALPESIALAETALNTVSSVWNVYGCTSHGVPVVFFDCRIGNGKGSWRRTVIAAEASHNVFDNIPWESSFTVDHSDKWHLFYEPKTLSFKLLSLMPIKELEARIDAIRHSQ